MLSIEEIKRLSNDPDMSDEKAAKVRDLLEGLADLAFDFWLKKIGQNRRS